MFWLSPARTYTPSYQVQHLAITVQTLELILLRCHHVSNHMDNDAANHCLFLLWRTLRRLHKHGHRGCVQKIGICGSSYSPHTGNKAATSLALYGHWGDTWHKPCTHTAVIGHTHYYTVCFAGRNYMSTVINLIGGPQFSGWYDGIY